MNLKELHFFFYVAQLVFEVRVSMHTNRVLTLVRNPGCRNQEVSLEEPKCELLIMIIFQICKSIV